MKLLGETEAPVVVRQADDRGALGLALVENLQREELNPIEQARAFERLGGEFEMSQEEIASAVGKDRATVANTVRLLRLPGEVQQEVAQGRLSLGHGRAILGLGSERSQTAVARRAVAGGLSVRQVERIVQEMTEPGKRRAGGRSRDPHLVAAEEKLQRSLGTRVHILHGKSRGWIRIAYYSLKELDRILSRLS